MSDRVNNVNVMSNIAMTVYNVWPYQTWPWPVDISYIWELGFSVVWLINVFWLGNDCQLSANEETSLLHSCILICVRLFVSSCMPLSRFHYICEQYEKQRQQANELKHRLFQYIFCRRLRFFLLDSILLFWK